MDKCPKCGSKNLVAYPELGELVCAKCGTVIREHMVSQAPEEYGFEQARTGPPISIGKAGFGLSTGVGDSRLIMAQVRSRTSTEKKLSRAVRILSRRISKLNLPNHIVQDAIHIYRRAVSLKMTSGRNIRVMLASSVYAACRRAGHPISVEDIAEAFEVSPKRLGKTFRLIASKLQIRTLPPKIESIVYNVSSRLIIDYRVVSEAVKIARKAEKVLPPGRNPYGVAAAALYIAAQAHGERLRQKDVASAAGVTEVTLRARIKELMSIIQSNSVSNINS